MSLSSIHPLGLRWDLNLSTWLATQTQSLSTDFSRWSADFHQWLNNLRRHWGSKKGPSARVWVTKGSYQPPRSRWWMCSTYRIREGLDIAMGPLSPEFFALYIDFRYKQGKIKRSLGGRQDYLHWNVEASLKDSPRVFSSQGRTVILAHCRRGSVLLWWAEGSEESWADIRSTGVRGSLWNRPAWLKKKKKTPNKLK